MKTYSVPFVPGPVSVPKKIRDAWLNDFGSSDMEPEFFELYSQNQALLKKLLKTNANILITGGEAMSILWASLKCTLKAGDKMLAVASGLFGEGFAEMAESFGVEAKVAAFPYDEVPDPKKTREIAEKFRPNVITAVHCETPSGTLNPYLKEIGEIARDLDALFVVDFVSSAGGADLNVDESLIDIGLLGSQKVLSVTPFLSISTISDRAWKVIKRVNYAGFEAYLPWEKVPEIKYMPYTHDWQAMAALNISLKSTIEDEGLDNAILRHKNAAKLCRDLGREIGLKLFPVNENISSPTVTTFYVPDKYNWEDFNAALRERGLVVGGNYGKLAGKTFRIGHMGSQADESLVKKGMEIIKSVINK